MPQPATIKCTLRALLLASVSLTTSLASAQGVTSVDVFANSAMAIQGADNHNYPIKIYRVDGLARLESEINQNLPQNESAARAWLGANQGRIKRQYQAQASNAANGMSLAIYYQLDRIPAIVINQQAVVYGITDVAQAVRLFESAPAAKAGAAP